MENIITLETKNQIDVLFRKDLDLLQHSKNVAILAYKFSASLNLSTADKRTLLIGAYLHDVGKVLVSKDLLYKPGKLSELEFETIKRHPSNGTRMILKLGIIKKQAIFNIIEQHHEREDGKGYPYGLKSGEIDYLAQIVQLCDVFDALVSKRVYKEPMTFLEALGIIEEGLGSQFNKELGMKFISFIMVRYFKEKERGIVCSA